MRTVLLTGATGFLGAHLAKTLCARGDRVRALRRGTSDLSRLAGLETTIDWLDAGDADDATLAKFLTGVDAVIHAAATYARHGESLSAIAATNIVFALRILEAATHRQVGLFIHIDSALPPQTNAYSLSKAQFAAWGRFMAERSQTRFLNLRVEHMYGPGDDESKFVDRVINACLCNEPSLALTAGTQQRDFIHVADVVDACLLLLERQPPMAERQAEIGLGSGTAIAVRDLVETIHRLTRSTTRLDFGAIPTQAGEVMYSCADLTPLDRLGWQPRIGIEDGLRQTIERKRS